MNCKDLYCLHSRLIALGACGLHNCLCNYAGLRVISPANLIVFENMTPVSDALISLETISNAEVSGIRRVSQTIFYERHHLDWTHSGHLAMQEDHIKGVVPDIPLLPHALNRLVLSFLRCTGGFLHTRLLHTSFVFLLFTAPCFWDIKQRQTIFEVPLASVWKRCKCKAIDMKLIFDSYANKEEKKEKKRFALCLVL